MRFFLILLLFFSFFPGFTQPNCPQIATYFGQIQHDDFKGVCADQKGNVYAIGNTYNNNLPTSAGVFQPAYKNDYEAYVVKFDSCGTFLWCTYFGTGAFDSGEKISYSAIDTSIVITGYTNGNDIATTPNCFQASSNGNYDCFLAKLNLNGQAKWVSYFGATNADFAYALTVDSDGDIIIGGTSTSTTIHTTASSFQQSNNGATDAFFAKFDKNGAFLFSTFYGGLNSEDIHSIATDSDRNIIAVGGSFSNNLSTTASCLQNSNGGGMDVYIIKFDPTGNRIFSTYAGGSGTDDAYGVCTNPAKDIFISGHTSSSDFYMTSVSHQTLITGNNDIFCMKITETGQLAWSTVFGGSSFDINVSCKLNGNYDLLVLNTTQSADFPLAGVANTTVYSGSGDLSIVRIGAQGQFLWSGYSGGSGSETGAGLLLEHNRVLVGGATSSPDLPVVQGNYQLLNNGQSDGFLLTVNVPGSPLTGIYEEAEKCFTISTDKAIRNGCDVDVIKVFDVNGKELLCSKTELVNVASLPSNQVYMIIGYNRANQIIARQKYLPFYQQ